MFLRCENCAAACLFRASRIALAVVQGGCVNVWFGFVVQWDYEALSVSFGALY